MSNWRRYSTFLFGCLSIVSCAGEPEVAAVPSASSSLISTELLAATWPVRMSEDQVRLPFEQDPAWGQVFRREYPEALGAFAAAAPTGRALARMHVEHAALYRQAALLAANSVRQVYGADRQDVDPVEVDYLLAASAGVMGDCAGAREALRRLQGANAALLGPQTAFLQAWADAPDCPRVPGGADVGVGAFPGQWTAAKAGTIPNVEALPHYRFTEKVEGGGELSATDPTSLLLLSRWHEAAALAAAPAEDASVVALVLDPWRLPGEAKVPLTSSTPAVADDWLFAGFLLMPADAAFLSAARQGGVAAVEAWKGKSALAAVVAPAIVDGKVDPDRMLDQAVGLGDQMSAAMVAKAGSEQGYQRPFVDISRVAALRAGMVVADATGEARDAGILRINALERSTGPASDPVFSISVAAWDAGNRNPQRAQDLLHGLSMSFPAVEAARYPLDAMHIRLARNAGPSSPVH